MKRNTILRVLPSIAVGLTLLIIESCKKDDPQVAPTVTTTEVTTISEVAATGGGTVVSAGSSAVTARGVCWSTGTTPTIGDSKTTDGTGTGVFVSSMGGLGGGTTYNVRAYATNAAGTGYGDVQSFTTLQTPSVTTNTIGSILVNTASGGGNVTSAGGSTITERGICWSTTSNPTVTDSKTTDGNGSGAFSSSMTDLVANTTYHVRAYAVNEVGTGYGDDVSFSTFGLIDQDGNAYHSVIIGNQEWMQENLKTTTYRNGTAIPNVTTTTDWGGLSSGAYASYDNSASNASTYGMLYNWFAVTDSRHVCPTGWHAPSDAEWDELSNELGGASVAGGKMKATTNWADPNTAATNESGFTGLPGGNIGDTSGGAPWHFSDLGGRGHWWSTGGTTSFANWVYLNFDNGNLSTAGNFSQNGKSVRCVKD